MPNNELQAGSAETSLSTRLGAAVADLLREGEAANTVTSYRTALRYWDAWHRLRFSEPIALPVPTPTVLQFVVDHLPRQTDAGLLHELPADVDAALVEAGIKGKLGALSLNTVLHRLAVLSKAPLAAPAAESVPGTRGARGVGTHPKGVRETGCLARAQGGARAGAARSGAGHLRRNT